MNKASGGDGIPVELFQILKDDAMKVLHSICQKIWKTQQWPQDWKRSVFISIPKKDNAKEWYMLNSCTLFTCQQGNDQSPSSQASTVLEQRNSRDSNWIQKRQRNQRSNCQHLLDHEKAREFQKNICLIDYAKFFDSVDHNKLWKILKEMGILDT